jgi:hypothetical protein
MALQVQGKSAIDENKDQITDNGYLIFFFEPFIQNNHLSLVMKVI